MKVFISWSGPRSGALAKALYDWLPCVIQAIEPWLSIEDIDKGSQWAQELRDRLEEHHVAILCLTPESLESKWLHFEAGAISKVSNSLACTVIHGVDPLSISGPLSNRQHTTTTKGDILRLLETFNARLPSRLTSRQLTTAFESMWGQFEAKLKDVDAVPIDVKQPKLEGDELFRAIRTEVQGLRHDVARLSANAPTHEFRLFGSVSNPIPVSGQPFTFTSGGAPVFVSDVLSVSEPNAAIAGSSVIQGLRPVFLSAESPNPKGKAPD